MVLYGSFLWVLFALGLFLLYLGIARIAITIAAPLAYSVNLLDVRSWTIDRFGFLPWVGPGHEYASAATFTVIFVLGGALIAVLGVLCLYLPAFLVP